MEHSEYLNKAMITVLKAIKRNLMCQKIFINDCMHNNFLKTDVFFPFLF